MAGRAEADNVAMRGGYSLATIGAKHVIDGASELVMDALDAMELAKGKGAFLITDMGTADAGTSLDMMGTAMARVRKAAPGRGIFLIYTDQAGNDYNAIVANVLAESSPLPKIDELYVSMSPIGFYRQIVPAGELDFGFSATAMHWMNGKPCNIPDHVHMTGATGKAREMFTEQGRRDWETILLHRARELKPGGRLVFCNFGIDEEGRYLGNTGGISMFDTFAALWQRFVDEGTITAAEFEEMTLPQYYNTVDEFRAPLEDTSSPVHKAGLRLEHIETRVVKCPFREDFLKHGDAAKFAPAYVPTLRSWTESTFRGALVPGRGAEAAQAITDAYYQAYVDIVCESPEGHAMDYVHSYMTISKQ